MLFSQNQSPEQYIKKPFPEKSSDKTFIVQVNQDTVTLTFIRQASTYFMENYQN